MADIDLSGLSVGLYMNSRDAKDITVPTMNAVISTLRTLDAYGIENEWYSRTGGDLNLARNHIAEKFLESGHNRAFLIDSDVAWDPKAALRILWHSLRYEVVGATYLAKSDERTYFVSLPPGGVSPDPRSGCIPIVGMGLGFTCVQRAVFEKLSAKAPKYVHVAHEEPLAEIFRFDKVPYSFKGGDPLPGLRGEDFAFFADVRDLGYVPMMDPTIELGHVGLKEWRGAYSERAKSVATAAA